MPQKDLYVNDDGHGNLSPVQADLPSSVPPGAILMWHGLVATIPSGWAIYTGAPAPIHPPNQVILLIIKL